MTLKTTIKHLRNIHTHIDSATERRAMAEAIAWLKGERRREVRADLRGRVIDHIDGNIRNTALGNLRVTTMPERAPNRKPLENKARRVPSIIMSGESGQ